MCTLPATNLRLENLPGNGSLMFFCPGGDLQVSCQSVCTSIHAGNTKNKEIHHGRIYKEAQVEVGVIFGGDLQPLKQ